MTAPRPNVARAALSMAAASLCFVLMDAIMREVARTHGIGMTVWARYATQVVLVLALLPFIGARRAVATRRPWLHAARGVMLILTTIFLLLALRDLSFATTYAITLTNPIIATILALAVLGERPTPPMIGFMLLGFAGVLVVLGPGGPAVFPAALFALAMATTNAGLHVLTRFLGRDEDPFALLFLIGMVAFALTTLALPWLWAPLSVSAWMWMFLCGAFGVGAHVGLIDAYRHAPTAVVAPLTYLQLVWAAGAGYLLFSETPTPRTLAGGALVVASGVLLVRAGMKK